MSGTKQRYKWEGKRVKFRGNLGYPLCNVSSFETSYRIENGRLLERI